MERSIKTFGTDNELEFVRKEFLELCSRMVLLGIEHM